MKSEGMKKVTRITLVLGMRENIITNKLLFYILNETLLLTRHKILKN